MLQKIQMLLAKNKQIIIKLWNFIHIVLFLIAILGPFPFLMGNDDLISFSELIARFFGKVAFIFYALSLVPGILGRLNIFRIVRSTITLYIRQIGITAFLLAFIHEGYIFTFPVLLSGASFFEILSSHEVYGYIAFFIMFIMWMTSNDLSVKKLGKYWKTLHRITYLALIFVFLHIATSEMGTLAYTALLMILLEGISWGFYFLKKVKTPSIQNK